MTTLNKFDFAQFYLRTTVSGHNHLLVRPGISVVFFLDEPVPLVCKASAELIEAFFSWVPRNIFRSYLAKDGYYKPLTNSQIAKDLKALRNLTASHKGYQLDYSEAELGEVGSHAIFIESIEPTVNRPEIASLIRLEFPEDIIQKWGEVRFLQIITEAAELLPFASAHAGFAFKRSMAFESASLRAVAPLLPRYIGFDPSDYWIATRMRGYTSTSHWINLLGPELTKTFGGHSEVQAKVGEAEIKSIRNGIWIRAARLPSIGDVNRGADDIGELPTVARFLRPVRCPNPRSGDRSFDVAAWLARFDDLPAKNWDNS